jgi:ABC-type glutathione transport system ATPase component
LFPQGLDRRLRAARAPVRHARRRAAAIAAPARRRRGGARSRRRRRGRSRRGDDPRRLSLALERPAIYCVIGPNGAGKTSTFDVLTGELPAQAGACASTAQPIGLADAPRSCVSASAASSRSRRSSAR